MASDSAMALATALVASVHVGIAPPELAGGHGGSGHAAATGVGSTEDSTSGLRPGIAVVTLAALALLTAVVRRRG